MRPSMPDISACNVVVWPRRRLNESANNESFSTLSGNDLLEPISSMDSLPGPVGVFDRTLTNVSRGDLAMTGIFVGVACAMLGVNVTRVLPATPSDIRGIEMIWPVCPIRGGRTLTGCVGMLPG